MARQSSEVNVMIIHDPPPLRSIFVEKFSEKLQDKTNSPVKNFGKEPRRLSQIILGDGRLSEEKFWKLFSFYNLLRITSIEIKDRNCYIM